MKEEPKVHIEFTKEEIEIIYPILMQEMKKSFKNLSDLESFITVEKKSPDDLFKILKRWYLLLDKIKVAKDLYEQATNKEENKEDV
jgi:hypothetical protein